MTGIHLWLLARRPWPARALLSRPPHRPATEEATDAAASSAVDPLAAVALVAGASRPPAPYAARATTRAASALETLEQEVAVVKRQLEVKQEDDTAKATRTPVVGAGPEGFFLRSPDQKYIGSAARLRAVGRALASSRTRRPATTPS